MTQKRVVRGISKPKAKPVADVRKPQAAPAVKPPAPPVAQAALPTVDVRARVRAQAATPALQARPPRVRTSTAPAAIQTLTTVDYAGESVPVNARQSRVALDFALWGTVPDQNITARTQAVYDALRQRYGSQPFPRGNIDSGVLKFLGAKGWIAHVAGGATDPGAQFRIAN